MRLLLHACCGPCSLEPTKLLATQGHDITLLYANSNIAPRAEYEKRLETLQAFAQTIDIPLIVSPYNPDQWEHTVGKLGDALLKQAGNPEQLSGSERALRCRMCYRLRLEKAAQYAAEHNYEALSTTLTVSPYQYVDIIDEELSRAVGNFTTKALFQDFRPYYKDATREARERGMYRQNYCGCRFSQIEGELTRAKAKQERARARAARRRATAATRKAAEEQREKRRVERRAYDERQAHKRAILKALRAKRKREENNLRKKITSENYTQENPAL